MIRKDLTPIVIERSMERIRQERETFNQLKKHENLWFYLRLSMGYSSIILLGAIIIIAVIIIFNSETYSATVVSAAGAAFFIDVLGLLVGVWKIALNPNFMTKLKPISDINLPSLELEEENELKQDINMELK